MLVLAEAVAAEAVAVAAAVVVVVVEDCDDRSDFKPPETGALCCFKRFIPANAFMTVGKRLRLLVANTHSDRVTSTDRWHAIG